MKKICLSFLFVGLFFGVQAQITTIAFGSCNDEDLDQSMWQYIQANNPHTFIWLGDNIYGDTHDMNVLRAKYQKQKNHAEYQQFIKSTPVIGVWDDHDYGINDGGKKYAKKVESKQLFMEFFDITSTDPMRSRKGVYGSYDLLVDGKKIKVILLDTRTFRDTLVADTSGDPLRRYKSNPDPSADILGKAQWKWLKNELKNSTADVHIIGSGIQMIPEEHGWEKWANIPAAQAKLYSLLDKANPQGLVLISGDRHMAEIMQKKLNNTTLTEATSSGLTHVWKEQRPEANKYRVGQMVYPRNFGLINIDWENQSITIEIRGLENILYYSFTFPIVTSSNVNK